MTQAVDVNSFQNQVQGIVTRIIKNQCRCTYNRNENQAFRIEFNISQLSDQKQKQILLAIKPAIEKETGHSIDVLSSNAVQFTFKVPSVNFYQRSEDKPSKSSKALYQRGFADARKDFSFKGLSPSDLIVDGIYSGTYSGEKNDQAYPMDVWHDHPFSFEYIGHGYFQFGGSTRHVQVDKVFNDFENIHQVGGQRSKPVPKI